MQIRKIHIRKDFCLHMERKRTLNDCGTKKEQAEIAIAALRSTNSGEAYYQTLLQERDSDDAIFLYLLVHFTSLCDIEIDKLPDYFFDCPEYVIGKNGSQRIDPTALARNFREHESYFFVIGKHEAVRAIRYLYNRKKGLYETISDLALKAKVKQYIERALPDGVKTRDINEAFSLICLDDRFKQPDAVDANEDIINFRNGILNIKTGEFMEHSPDILSTIQVNAQYDPGKTYTLDDAPTFRKYIRDLTAGDESEQKIQLLLEVIGVVLSNVPGYKFKAGIFMIGRSNSGKSQLINLISGLIGTENSQSVLFSKLSDRFTVSSFYDKRFVFSGDEVYDSTKSNQIFMLATGGDPVPVEFKGFTSFQATFKGLMLFTSNELPKWSGNKSQAAYNRIVAVMCNNVVKKFDKNICSKMLEEREAIVYLAVEALKRAIQRGYRYTQTAENEAAIEQIKRENNPANMFFEECCIYSDETRMDYKRCATTNQVHTAFQKWCADNGFPPPKRNQLEKDFADCTGIQKDCAVKKVRGTRYYYFGLTTETKEKYNLFDVI